MEPKVDNKDFAYDWMVNDRVTEFLSQLRSENTRELVRQIVAFLLEKRKEHWENAAESGKWLVGWTRSSEIFKAIDAQNPFTVTRLLHKLSEANIIDRRECTRVKGQPGKKPVFYKLPAYYDPVSFESREVLLKRIKNLQHSWVNVRMHYSIAKSIFEERTREPLDPLVKVRFDQWVKKQDKRKKEMPGGEIKELDPCNHL
jgi:hypothetical protein